jgi:preprotein translocase subunit SecB
MMCLLYFHRHIKIEDKQRSLVEVHQSGVFQICIPEEDFALETVCPMLLPFSPKQCDLVAKAGFPQLPTLLHLALPAFHKKNKPSKSQAEKENDPTQTLKFIKKL